MFYAKKNAIGSVRRAKVTIRDFSGGVNGKKDEENLSVGECAFSYNFRYDGGTLKDGGGVKKADFGTGPLFAENTTPTRLYFYKKYNATSEKYEEYLMVYCTDGFIYKAGETDSTFTKVDDLKFTAAPYAVEYNYKSDDVMIFSAGSALKIYDGENVTDAEDVPSITSMCVHSERLFATESGTKTSLWFSDDFDPLNWKVSLDEAGFIDIREGAGSLLKVLSFGGYVYVFANYGIVRVSASGDQTEFSVDGIAASSGRIYGESIAISGDRIIYLAEDGFYSFSGGTPARIMTKLDGKLENVDNSDAKGCYFNGEYYCKMYMRGDSGLCEVMVRYDIHNGNIAIIKGADVKDFIVAGGESKARMLFLVKGINTAGTLSERAENFSKPLNKHWVSGKSDLGKTDKKCVTALSLRTVTDIDVTVRSERGSRLLHFFGSKERQKKAVGLKGDTFTFSIDCNVPGARISAVEIEYEY